MGALRVTQNILVQRTLNNINIQTRNLLKLQDQLATGRRVISPSDDPIAARRGATARAAIQKLEQYIENISNLRPQFEVSAQSMQVMVQNLHRVRELTVQGANGTVGQEQLDNIAAEIDQLLEAAVNVGNQTNNNNYIFAGTRTQTQPFAVTRNVDGDITAVTYEGNGERIGVAIGDSVELFTNEPGSTVFQGSQDIFQLLIDIRDDLRAGDQASLQNVRLNEIDAAMAQLGQGIARIGAAQNRLDGAESDLEDIVIQNQRVFSESIDADLAETIINLNVANNAFTSSLNAASRVIQPSLLDFLR